MLIRGTKQDCQAGHCVFTLRSGTWLEDKRNSIAIVGQAAKVTLVDMKPAITAIESMKLTAQETLDELFAQHLIPFKLSARVVESLGLEEYIVRFHDSRLRSVD